MTFTKGHKLSVGRLVGSRNKAQLELDKIGMEKACDVIHVLVAKALEGDAAHMKMLLDRIYPISKAISNTYVKGNLSGITTQTDVNEAMTNILGGVGDTAISLEEALQTTTLIKVKSDSIQLCMAEELEQLKTHLNGIKNNVIE